MLQFVKKIKFEWLAFCLILFFGICLRIVTPPFQTSDEVQHFTRAWQVSEGKFLSPAARVRDIESGNNPITLGVVRWASGREKFNLHNEDEKFLIAEVPRALMPYDFTIDFANKFHKINFEMIKKFLFAPINFSDTEFHLIPNIGQYSPLAYFPQAIAAFLGRFLNLNAGIIYYSMCLAALLFVAVCVRLSMKLLPEKKFLIFLLAMMPMFLVEIISTSADAVTYGICFLGTAWLLSMRKNFDAITYKEIFGLITLSVCLGLVKSVYGTILLLYFLIPRQRFKKFFYFASFGIFLLALELSVASLWTYFAVTANDVALFSNFYLGRENVDIVAQKNFILANPIELFIAIFNTLTYNESGILILTTFLGWLGEYSLLVPSYFVWSYSIILVFIGGFFGTLDLNFFQRTFIFFVILVSIIGIFSIEYLIWTPVGANIIEGMSGRYFIPIALFSFAIFSVIKPPKYSTLIVLLCGIFSAVFTIFTTYSAFY